MRMFASILAFLLLLPSTVMAQEATEVYIRYKLPPGRRITLQTPKLELQAFTFQEYLTLLEMDADLRKCDITLLDMKTKDVEQEKAILSLQEGMAVSTDRLLLYKEDNHRLSQDLSKSLEKNLLLEQKLEKRNSTLFITGSVGLAVIVSLTLGLVFGG